MAENNVVIRARIRKANQLLQQGKFDEAAVLYEQLCRLRPQDTDLQLTLAVIYRRQGNLCAAATTCNRVLSSHCELAAAHNIAGSIQQCQGDFARAIDSYRTAIRLDRTLVEAHYFLGNILQLTGESEAAVSAYREAIRLRPEFLEAKSNLGAVLTSLRRFEEARSLFEEALRLSPGQPQVLCNLGDLYLMQDKPQEAMRFARAAANAAPGNIDAHYLMGRISRQQGEYDQALQHFRTALDLQPDNQHIIGSMSEVYEIRGHFDEARALIVPLIEKHTTTPMILITYSALSRHYGTEREAVGLLEDTINNPSLEAAHKIRIHSELGKQYNRLKEYAKAFSHYQEANLLERQLNVTRPEDTTPGYPKVDTIRSWHGRYDRHFWQALPRSGNTSDRPIFIIGMPRSGTTLAEQILSSHPAVYGAGELADIAKLAAQAGDMGTSQNRFDNFAKLDSNSLLTAASSYLSTLDTKSEVAQRVVDKMPTNFWHMGFISLLFPRARVIHMQRDPRDTCLSMYFQRFGALVTYMTDLRELAHYYHSYSSIMQYWYTVLDMPVLHVHYEQLVTDQENQIPRMIEFCGLEWDDSCLGFHKTRRDVNTPSYDQVRQPMYEESIGRWKHYEAELRPLIEALGPDILSASDG